MLDLTPLRQGLTDAYLAHSIFWDKPADTDPFDIIIGSTIKVAELEAERLMAALTRKQLKEELSPAVEARLTDEEHRAFLEGFRWDSGIPEQAVYNAVWRIALTIVGEIHRRGLTSHERMEALARIRRREEA